ncbi:hypothetical protein [Streptomyces sp. NBC_00503]|uniref:hypothetical protein n=1 Tax=Streptomyces sp. NBC_00503 TaxID=2903659 RepID=UPI002E800247|nr:hypothetical protein [Streptomyces sp. NBC_00503]WUD84394.1 hypothetical protein OG490_29675 [Streptomyces sp. NBC_00503]
MSAGDAGLARASPAGGGRLLPPQGAPSAAPTGPVARQHLEAYRAPAGAAVAYEALLNDLLRHLGAQGGPTLPRETSAGPGTRPGTRPPSRIC